MHDRHSGMTRRGDPDRIREAQEAGDAARAGNHLDTDDWVRRLPPASERMRREALPLVAWVTSTAGPGWPPDVKRRNGIAGADRSRVTG